MKIKGKKSGKKLKAYIFFSIRRRRCFLNTKSFIARVDKTTVSILCTNNTEFMKLRLKA